MTRHYKWHLFTIVGVALVYVAISAYPPEGFSFLSKDRLAQPKQAKSNDKLTVAKSGEINSVTTSVNNTSGLDVAAHGGLKLSIGESTVRQLLLSNNINLVEYAFTRVRRICSSYESGAPNAGLQSHIIARTNDDAASIRKLDGRGTRNQRMLAAEQLQKKCAVLTAGVAVNSAERDAAIAAIEAAGFPMREWINARSKAGRREAMIDASTAELGQKLLKSTLIGEIGNLMRDVNSYELPNIVGEADSMYLATIAADYILMCRMGEDCGPNSLASNRFCAEDGYCGGHVEETLMSHFHQAGLDWTLFEKYINRLQNATISGDVSIFRAQPPVSPPKPILAKPSQAGGRP